MKKIKTIILVVGTIVIVIGSHVLLSPWLKNPLVPVSLADDDEEGEDEHEDEEDDKEDDDDEKVEYKTVYTKLPDTVVTTTKQIPRVDSDKDGKYDDEDPNPTINEFLIVKDDNFNGIDDQYEQ